MVRFFDWVFDFGIFVKGIHGLLEIFAGIFLLFVEKSFLSNIFVSVFRHELLEDPVDFLGNFFISFFHGISLSTKHFFSAYLILYGIVNLLVAISFLSKKSKLYLSGIAVFSFSILYQIYRLVIFHSTTLFFITLFDIFILGVVVTKYQKIRFTFN